MPLAPPRRRRRVLGGLALATAALLVGCGSGRLVLPIALDPASVTPPPRADELTTDTAAVRGIAAILSGDVGLPLPPRVTVYVYASREQFRRGLVRDAQVAPARAAELSEFAIGVGRRGRLLLNAGVARGRERLRLIAHELTHVAQIELAEGEGRAEQWLAEGMADWAAFRVLERLALDTLAERREAAARDLREHAALVSAPLDLESLGTSRGFTVRHRRDGSRATYQLAFLMADYLLAREGLPRVLDYFRACARGPDRRHAFARAFGQTLEAFEGEVLAHLGGLVGGVARGVDRSETLGESRASAPEQEEP